MAGIEKIEESSYQLMLEALTAFNFAQNCPKEGIPGALQCLISNAYFLYLKAEKDADRIKEMSRMFYELVAKTDPNFKKLN